VAKKRRKTAGRVRLEAPPRPPAPVLFAAALLAAASGAWALHLWRELALAKLGGDVTCPFGSTGDCGTVWQSGFAQTVERASGLPVAAHGVLWAIVAFALPVAVLVARARGRRGEVSWAAVLVTAAAGVLAVMGLAAAQLVDGHFCASCAIAYAFTLAYAGLCFFSSGSVPFARLARGGLLAGAAAGLSFAALAVGRPEPPAPASASLGTARLPATASTPRQDGASGDALSRFVAALSPVEEQLLGRALRDYEGSEPQPLREPRSLLGSPMAPVRITDFADLLCSHCAALHATLAQLRRTAPEGSFAVESRYFPLDGACNPKVEHASKDALRCTAARVMICLEGDPGAFDVAGEIYANQRDLTEERLYQIASRARPRDELEACARSPETEAKLQSDIAWAASEDIQGTPLVLVNGRKATPFPAFLWAIVLSGGDPGKPSLAALSGARSG
jgi:protein-disulfide isomerase